MERALKLAAKAKGKTFPNPLVGAVFVKDGKIIAEGFHKKAGGAHAEVEALRSLNPSDTDGGTLYVTLEPCAHYGKTPPCAIFLISMGVKHVKVAMRDPFPLVDGKGIEILKRHGVKVEVGLLRKEAETLNESFLFNIKAKRPFVVAKLGMSLDGKIANRDGKSKWITNEKSRKEVHKLRSSVDAIITSYKTVLADNPHLGVRMSKGRDPIRVIIDSKLKTKPNAQVYRDSNVIVVTNSKVGLGQFKKLGVDVIFYKGKRIPLKKLMEDLYAKKKIGSLLLEAGAGLFTEFSRAKLINMGYFFISPKIIGEGRCFTLYNSGLYNVESIEYGGDLLIKGYFSDAK